MFSTKICCNKKKILSNYHGLGGRPIPIWGKFECRVEFVKKTYKVLLHIVDDNLLPLPVLLGRDALKIIEVHLVHKKNINANQNTILSSLNHEAANLTSASLFTKNQIISSISQSSSPNNYEDKLNYTIISNQFNSNKQTSPIDEQSNSEHQKERDEFNHFCANVVIEEGNLNVGLEFGSSTAEDCKELIRTHYLRKEFDFKAPPKYQLTIRLTDTTPFYCAPRRLSYYKREKVTEIVEDLLEKIVIRHSESPYASPLVLVKKKSGELRMCVDYRGLNKRIIKDNFPLPLIEDCLEFLENKCCFSIIDLKSGYHQIGVEEKSVQYTAFVTPQGQ